jgi:hypothetical protein
MRAAASSGWGLGAARRSQGRSVAGQASPDALERGFAFASLCVLLFLNIAMQGWKVGPYPVRGILAIGLLALLSMWYTDRLVRVVRRHSLILGLAAGLAVLGTLISLMNGATAEVIIKGVTEVHLQVAVTLLLAGVIAETCGPRACVLAIVAAVGISAFVAVLQIMDIDAAWQWRTVLAQIQGQPLNEVKGLATQTRPMGLSYSAIQLGTQLCLAFAAYTAWRDIDSKQNGARGIALSAAVSAVLAIIVVSIASGNRSPIVGVLLFLALFCTLRRVSAVPVVVAGLFLYLAWPMIMSMIESIQPRVVSLEDNSAPGRYTLNYYGLRLFLDNPLGYGFGFKPFDHWTAYWQEIYTLGNPDAIRDKPLHNYVITMFNTYGVGLLLFAPVVATLLKRGGSSILFFTPYMLHILFHNAGPFFNDTVVWFVVAAIAAAAVPDNANARMLRRRPAAARADDSGPLQAPAVAEPS